MRSVIFLSLCVQAFLFAGTSHADPSKNVVSDKFVTLEIEASRLCRLYGCQNVLAGFDIDNTLLNPPQELASDEWVTWQMSLGFPIPGQSMSPNAVAADMNGLLRTWGFMVNQFHDQPVDPDAPKVVKTLQNAGIQSIVITARGSEVRPATVRELDLNDYNFRGRDFRGRAQLPFGGSAGTFLPYDLAHPEISGLKPEELAKFGLKQPAPVSFADGVFMVAGQHKGVMLRTLLAKAKARYKAILYIDDTPVQVQHMQQAFADGLIDGSQLEVTTVQFSNTYPRVVEFFESDKSEVVRELGNFVKGLSPELQQQMPPELQQQLLRLQSQPAR